MVRHRDKDRHTEPDRWVPNVWKGFTVRYFIIHIIFMYCVHDVHVYIVYLSAYARQPARGPTMWFKRLRATAGQGPNYVGPFCGYVGLCWSILRAMWAHLVAMLAYVGLRLIHVEPKDPKNGNSKKKHCKTQDILMVGGLSCGYVGPSWGYVGPSWGLCCPSLRLCGPILELCWPILGLCWPILGAMLPDLGAMLAHLEAYVGPC